jgi:hypothetical protein
MRPAEKIERILQAVVTKRLGAPFFSRVPAWSIPSSAWMEI